MVNEEARFVCCLEQGVLLHYLGVCCGEKGEMSTEKSGYILRINERITHTIHVMWRTVFTFLSIDVDRLSR